MSTGAIADAIAERIMLGNNPMFRAIGTSCTLAYWTYPLALTFFAFLNNYPIIHSLVPFLRLCLIQIYTRTMRALTSSNLNGLSALHTLKLLSNLL